MTETVRRTPRPPRGTVTGRTWLIRGLVAIVAGAAIGIAAGVTGVNRMEPGRPGQPESLQLMLDSLRRLGADDDPITQRRAADSADAAHRAQRVADSISLANDPDAPIVPDVVRMEEGVARQAIEDAGLTVGNVVFRPDSTTAGIVLATTPRTGRKVRFGTAVDLVLSDGRTVPPDSLDARFPSTVSPLQP